jgi:hypothetical protein
MPTIAKFLGVARNSASKIGGVDYFSLGKMTGVQNFDPDAKAYIQRVEGASGDNQILEIGVRYAINDFVVGCKDDGIWNAIKASCIMAGARTLAGALQPLVGTAPTNVGGLFVSDDYNRKTGLKGGSTKYLNSNRNNNADPRDNKHLAAVTTSVKTTGQFHIVMGTDQLLGDSLLGYRWDGVDRIRHAANSFDSHFQGVTGITLSAGFLGASRSSSSGYTLRRNGFSASITNDSASPTSTAISIFRATNINLHNDDRLAFYSIGEALNLAQLDSRVSALITAINGAIP